MIGNTLRSIRRLALCGMLLCVSAQALFAQQQQQRNNQGGNRNTGQNRGATGGSSSGSTRQYNSNGTVGDAVITSDPETRRLIVITDEETSRYVGQVITNLDKPKPQVLINVVFLEVTHDKNLDVGVEGSYNKKINSDTSVGLTNGFGLLSQGVANPAWGTPGAGMYSVAGKDFQVSLRAIAESGKMEVLSRPSILARNNQQATILVGQQIPIISNVRYDTIGNQINTVTYQDVGIILKVTPFITSDGMVEMIVSPEISALDKTQSSPISKDVSAPIINKRSADTVVVTPDGQPVIIGGLMQNTKSETDSRVPILGDIPGLGYLFKRKAKGNTKTELMIFLTPHIVQQPNQLASMTAREKSANELAPNAFSEEQLNRYLNSTPAPKPVDPKASKKGKKN